MAEGAYATGPAPLGAPRFAQFRFFSAGPKKCEAPETARPRHKSKKNDAPKLKKEVLQMKKRGAGAQNSKNRPPKQTKNRGPKNQKCKNP